ncbi:MAG: hypothetical protein HW405_253 [Candidatus Berkelbacteria bacterium]|nr:hypothetical protein [Candidatus Berkelbacteria bacterium]
MKRHVKCPWCLCLNTQRWGTRKVGKRKIQKFKCFSCGHTFSNRLTKGKLTANEKVNIARTHLEGRTSIRQLVRNTGFAKQTIQNAVYQTVKNCVDSAFIAKNLKPNWGGNLVVDGTTIRVYDWSAKHFRYSKEEKRFLHKLIWIVALDLETLDIVHQYLGNEETMIDLILFFREIKKIGYDLTGLVSDGNRDIKRSAQMVFNKSFSHQLCITHYIRSLRTRFREEKITLKRYEKLKTNIYQETWVPGLPRELFTYQRTKSLPKTNQQIENLFRQLKLRTHSINQFQSYITAKNYLTAWSLARRFTPFTLNLKTHLFLGR